MATGEEMATLQNLLREEAKGKTQPATEVKEEVKEEVVEEVKEVAEVPAEEVKEVVEEKTEEPAMSDRVQARIDGLIERLIEKDKKLAEMEKKVVPVKTEGEPVYTKEQLISLIADDNQPANVKAWATDKLTDIKVDEKLGKYEQSNKLKTEVVASYERAKTEYPEMVDKSSELWQKANEIYVRKNLGNDPDGQYIAATLAYRELEKANSTNKPSNEVLEKRLAKEAGKKSLATVTKKVVINSADVIATLEKEAIGKGPNDPAWRKLLVAMEKDRLGKLKK